MANIEALGVFHKIFQVFGLQFYSLMDQQGNWRYRTFNRIYCATLVVVFSAAMLQLMIFVIVENAKEKANNYFDSILNYIIYVLFLLNTIVPSTESYAKNEKLVEILSIARYIVNHSISELNHVIDYKSFRRTWIIKFIRVNVIFLMIYATLAVGSAMAGTNYLSVMFGFLPSLLFILITLKITYYVDLVNFQLRNLQIIVQEKIFPTKLSVRRNKALAARRVYNLIYEMSLLVNQTSAVAISLHVMLLTIMTIRAIFNALIFVIDSLPLKNVFGAY